MQPLDWFNPYYWRINFPEPASLLLSIIAQISLSILLAHPDLQYKQITQTFSKWVFFKFVDGLKTLSIHITFRLQLSESLRQLRTITENKNFTFRIYSEVAKSCRRTPRKEPFAIEHYV